jgi:hypothetical protein
MTESLKYFRSILLILGILFSESATADSIENFAVAGWEGGAYASDETGHFTFCVVVAKYKNGTSLFFKMGAEYQVDIGITSSDLSLRDGERFKARLSVDDAPPFTGHGYASVGNAAIFPITTDSASFNLFRRGRELDVTFSGKSYRYRLDGTARALARLERCVIDNRDYQRPAVEVVAPPAPPPERRPDRYRTIVDAVAMTANIATNSGLRGFRIIVDENDRNAAGSPDILWSAENLVGFTNVFDGDEGQDVESRAAMLATSAGPCRNVVRSETRREEINTVPVTHVLSECLDTGGRQYTIHSVIVPRVGGGVLEFTFMPADPTVETETADLESAAMSVLTGG